MQLAQAPSWMQAAAQKHGTERRQGEEAETFYVKGERNAALASLAGSMRRRGLSEAVIRGALLVVNVDTCDPPLDVEEVERIAASIAQYPPAFPEVGSVEEIYEHLGELADLSEKEYVETKARLRDRFGQKLKSRELDRAVKETRIREILREPEEHAHDAPYVETERGLVWLKHLKEEVVPVPLTNFTARILSDLIEDDGVETKRVFEIEVKLGNRTYTVTVPTSQFAGMSWVPEKLGAGAVISAGMSLKDHTRAAIQSLSGEVPERRLFTHTGWRIIDGQPIFLHADGALGADGPVEGIEVNLPDSLSRFVLPDDGGDIKKAVQATLSILGVVPDRLSIPLLAAVFRAPLGSCRLQPLLRRPDRSGKD